MSSLSGLALSIRNATEPETFDLAGSAPATIKSNIRDAFAEPFAQMVRLTFITGAGKLGRQKYHESAAKSVTSTLQELGFREDRGASAILECAGSYKLQHDTGKNLKTVVIFPLVQDVGQGDRGEQSSSTQSLILPETPQHRLAFSSLSVLKQNLPAKCPTWSQKKACVAELDQLVALIASLDGKLMTGTPLTDSEQDCYDNVTELSEKQAAVKTMMQEQVQQGKLTRTERDLLLSQVREKIKKQANPKLKEREELLMNVKPLDPPPLKNQAKIFELRKEMMPLMDIDKGKQLLSVKETQAVAKRTEMEEEIKELEMQSRGWFESDEAFEERLKLSRGQVPKKSKKPVKKAPAAPTKWVTPATAPRTTWKKPAPPKKSVNTNLSLYEQMMMDSDSD